MERITTKTILSDKLNDELSHIAIYEGIYQNDINGITSTHIVLSEEPSNLVDQEINQIINDHVPTPIKHKIEDYISSNFIDYPIYKIDFTLHLEKNVVLAKSVYKHPNGRPDRAEYLLDTTPMARITWEFIDATGGLYQEKKLWLSYYLENGAEGERFLIEHEIIDFTIPNQLEKSIEERVVARRSIVGEIKAVCSGALQIAYQETLEQIIQRIKPFWDVTKPDRENFIELATNDWRTYIASPQALIDYPWLETPVSQDGTTAQQYMLFRLGY
jgi:hypothetical protein